MKMICPTLGEGDELDFLVTGSVEDFKIIVFSDLDNYRDGFEYLKLADYKPKSVDCELFFKLASDDEAFSGIIINIHSQNKIITSEKLRQMKELHPV